MGTLTEELFSQRLGRRIRAGDTVVAEVDCAMAHDVTAPFAIDAFRRMEMPLFDPARVVLAFDHVMPANTVAVAEMHRGIREFAAEHGVRNCFAEGICHQVMIDRGLARPGGIVVGADSHSTTYGALGCFATGLGSTDMGVVFATGRTWFRVPETLRIEVHGELQHGVDAKDLALHVIGRLGAEGASYLAVEWGGETVEAMRIDQRLTLCNLGVDFGAKAALCEPDTVLAQWLGEDLPELHPDRPQYVHIEHVDASAIEPTISAHPSIDNARLLRELEGLRVDEVFIGSCTNGRLEDLGVAASYLRGRTVHPRTRTLVVPASRRVWQEALRAGYLDTFVEAGALVMNPGCGPCLGRQHGVLGPGERALSTSNRNYPGRMGSAQAEIYLASPAVAAASALAGAIADPRTVDVLARTA